MSWHRRQDELLEQLPPEVAGFVRRALGSVESENLFDAPSVIAAVLGLVRTAESPPVRAAAEETETLLKSVFAHHPLARA